MKEGTKVKLSNSLILTKLFCIVSTILCLSLISDKSKSDSILNFKYILEYKLLFLVILTCSIYFFTRPALYYDESSLYIKPTLKSEFLISFEQIESLDYFYARGGGGYVIKYKKHNPEIKSIRFYSVSSEISDDFISKVKFLKPNLKVT